MAITHTHSNADSVTTAEPQPQTRKISFVSWIIQIFSTVRQVNKHHLMCVQVRSSQIYSSTPKLYICLNGLYSIQHPYIFESSILDNENSSKQYFPRREEKMLEVKFQLSFKHLMVCFIFHSEASTHPPSVWSLYAKPGIFPFFFFNTSMCVCSVCFMYPTGAPSRSLGCWASGLLYAMFLV